MNYEHIKLGESLLPFRPESFLLCMLSKHTTTEIHTIIIFPDVQHECETLSLTWNEEQVLSKILQPTSDEEKEAGDNCITRSLFVVFLSKYYSGDQIKKDEMGGELNKFGEEEIWTQGETWGERDHLEDLGVDGRVIVKWISKK